MRRGGLHPPAIYPETFHLGGAYCTRSAAHLWTDGTTAFLIYVAIIHRVQIWKAIRRLVPGPGCSFSPTNIPGLLAPSWRDYHSSSAPVSLLQGSCSTTNVGYGNLWGMRTVICNPKRTSELYVKSEVSFAQSDGLCGTRTNHDNPIPVVIRTH